VNNDVLVEPSWLRSLADALDADSQLGAVCPKVLFSMPIVDVEIRVAHTTRLGVRVSGLRGNGDDRTA
jgi:hypothetical protein